MIGGVLLLTALQTLLAGTTLPYATRAILYGTGRALRRDGAARKEHVEREPAMAGIVPRPRTSGSSSRPAPPASAAPSPTSLIEHGARVHVCDVSEASLDDFRHAHPGHGTSVCDVSDEAEVEQLFADVRGTLGGLDALVNNAGIAGPTGGVEEISPADWRRTHRHLPHRPVPLHPPCRAAAQGGRRGRDRQHVVLGRAASAMRSARPMRPPNGA